MTHRSAWSVLCLLAASLPLTGLQCNAPLTCIDDSDCTGGADFCSARGVCVDCINDDDCDAGEGCQDGACDNDAEREPVCGPADGFRPESPAGPVVLSGQVVVERPGQACFGDDQNVLLFLEIDDGDANAVLVLVSVDGRSAEEAPRLGFGGTFLDADLCVPGDVVVREVSVQVVNDRDEASRVTCLPDEVGGDAVVDAGSSP